MKKLELKIKELNNGEIEVDVFDHFGDYIIKQSTHSSLGYVYKDYCLEGEPNFYVLLDWLNWLRRFREDFKIICGDKERIIKCKNIPEWKKVVEKKLYENISQETGCGAWGMRFSKDGKLDKEKFNNFILSL